MKLTFYKTALNILLRMPNWFFAALFIVAFPIYKALHQKRAYGRTVAHLQKARAFRGFTAKCTADDVFRGIYWNAIDSYRGLARLKRTTDRIVYENENVMMEALTRSKSSDGTPLPLAAISIHQGAFELLHRSLCRYSDNVHLITDSVGDEATRQLLKELRSDEHLTEYHPDELSQLLRNLFAPPAKLNKKGNAILAMVVDQGRHTKGCTETLFGMPSTLYLRLPEKVNQMGAGIVTFRTFTRAASNCEGFREKGCRGNQHRGKNEIVIRFETYYPPKFDQRNNSTDQIKISGTSLTSSIAKEIENWISENPSEWSWNYHGNFRV
ncbi:hypothetical protein MMG03_000669 [Fibrobacter succinogenes]|nr:hypothetical protein [Fibrobacter succinogenes]